MRGNFWSAAEDADLGRFAEDGLSAADISARINRTRRSIIGRCNRIGIKLKGKPRGGKGCNLWTLESDQQLRDLAGKKLSARQIAARIGRTIEAVYTRCHKIGAKLQGKPGTQRSNVVILPVVRREPIPTAPHLKPKLTFHTNTELLVADYLKKHGARRFERGFSTDYSYLQIFLRDRGFSLSMQANAPYLAKGSARPRKVSWQEVWKVVDKFRADEGLTPIVRSA